MVFLLQILMVHYTSIKNIKLHSYQVTAQNSDTATATGDIGGSTVTATRNMMFDVIIQQV